MVLDLLSLVALPTTIAVVEGARHQHSQDKEKKKDAHEQSRMRDFHIDIFCNSNSRKRDQVHGTIVVLRDGRLWLAEKDEESGLPKPTKQNGKADHPFTGFYLDFTVDQAPSSNVTFSRLNKIMVPGLVSTIPSPQDPSRKTLNWIYVHKTTYEVRYGPREEAQEHILGPWNWTDDELDLTLEGWEGFVAVEVVRGDSAHGKRSVWQLFFDRNDDKLKGKVVGKRVLEVSLERRVIEDDDEAEDVTLTELPD